MDDEDDQVDAQGQGQEDVGLPKSTLAKVLGELMPKDLSLTKETRDFIGVCSLEFIHLLSSEGTLNPLFRLYPVLLSSSVLLRGVESGLATLSVTRHSSLNDNWVESITKLNFHEPVRWNIANDISEKDKKKTMGGEHVLSALTSLGFNDYVPDVKELMVDHLKSLKDRERKSNRLEDSGLSQEELLKAQEELFANARNLLSAQPTPQEG